MKTDNLKISEKKEKNKNIVRIACEGLGRCLSGLLNQERPDEAIERKYHGLFGAWFNNHMAVVYIFLQRVRKRDAERIARIQYFLFDLEHHYLKTNIKDDVRNAFCFMKDFFTKYPNVGVAEVEKAYQMLEKIYDAFGLPLSSSLKPAKRTVGYEEVIEVQA